MNTVLANSVTKLAISGNADTTTDEQLLDSLIRRNAVRSVKGITRERELLDASKLFSLVQKEFKSHRGMESKSRLTLEVELLLRGRIDEYINAKIRTTIHAGNAMTSRRAFRHDFRNRGVVEAVSLTGKNILQLEAQKTGVLALIADCERKLANLLAKPTPDYDREKSVKEEQDRLEMTKTFIDASLQLIKDSTK